MPTCPRPHSQEAAGPDVWPVLSGSRPGLLGLGFAATPLPHPKAPAPHTFLGSSSSSSSGPSSWLASFMAVSRTPTRLCWVGSVASRPWIGGKPGRPVGTRSGGRGPRHNGGDSGSSPDKEPQAVESTLHVRKEMLLVGWRCQTIPTSLLPFLLPDPGWALTRLQQASTV